MFSFLRRKKDQKETTEQSIDSAIEENQEVTSNPNNSEGSNTQEASDENSTTQQTTEIEASISEATTVVEVEEPQSAIDEAIQTKSAIETEANNHFTDNIEPSSEDEQQEVKAEEKSSFFTRLKKGLSKTRHSFTESIASLVLGRKEIDEDLLDELEMILLTADVGIDATDRIIQNLTEQVSRKELRDPEALITSLKNQLQEILEPMSRPLDIDSHLAKNSGPFVILMVGINGVGKTTTIGKLAKKYQLEGKSVMLAAGDTFRAAAVEQLQTWGERNNVPVMAQKTGADSAAVIFDAIQSAKAKKIDVLIADTAGRLHTQSNLMEELKKVKRVIAKVDETAPHEVMLVIDAGTGQNALNQAQQFQESVEVSGITLTKLDGTAKGGIVFALAEQRQIPIRFIGVGESIDDLRTFDSKSFTEALFDQSTTS